MLLSGVLFVLFLAGCWLYCLTDAALTPAEEFPGWRKRTWLVVIAVTLIAGAIAWLIARRNWRPEDQWAVGGHPPDHRRPRQPERRLALPLDAGRAPPTRPRPATRRAAR